MKNKVLIMFVLASLCGGGAVLLARGVLEERDAARAAAVVDRPAVEFQSIVVARQPLRFGAVLSSELLTTLPWPSGTLPAGAFGSVDDLLAGDPRAVLTPLEPNEPVLASKITGPGERAALSRLVGEGNRAVTLRVDNIAGVAGFVLPGDRVDVMLTGQIGDEVSNQILLQGVRVLSIDQMADERAEGPHLGEAVTVEVDPASAQKIALAQTVGRLSLSLRRSGESAPVLADTVTVADFGRTEMPPVAAALEVPAVPLVERETTVGVTRLLERQEYRVLDRTRSDTPPATPVVDRIATASTGKVTR